MTGTTAATHNSRAAFRPEIQALRAAAIAAVLLYHLWPGRLTGGYVGVDVFFVISGYLISAHLIRDLGRGTRTPFAFWARRIRRLMPASLLTLFVAGLLTLAFVPARLWQQFASETVASALYVENWWLAGQSVDYLGATAPPSLVQHFWTLSVEEQFYIAWPLLLLGGAWIARKVWRHSIPVVTLVGAAAVAVISFAYAWYASTTDPAPAFFATTTRVWEFALGAMLAALVALRGTSTLGERWRPAVATPLAWAGWAAIAASFLLFDAGTVHPGPATLLPVLGTVAVIAAGDPAGRLAPGPLVRLRPVRWLGDVSYSLYLWHWPLVALLPFAFADIGPTVARVGILVASLVLAEASYRWVERPVLDRNPRLIATTPRAMVAMAVGIAVVAAAPVTSLVVHQRALDRAQVELQAEEANPDPCRGAPAVLDPSCAGEAPATYVPTLDLAPQDHGSAFNGADCASPDRTSADVLTCVFATGSGDGPRVLLVGDSHARHLVPLVAALARDHDWTATLAYKSSCPFTSATRDRSVQAETDACREWNANIEQMLADEPYDLIITSQIQDRDFVPADGLTAHQTGEHGLVDTWTRVNDLGTRVLAIKDNPLTDGDPALCMYRVRGDWADACTRAEDAALRWDPQVAAAAQFAPDRVQLVSLDDAYCWDGRCHVAIGGAVVYRDDGGHLTATWARSLAPAVEQRAGADFLDARLPR